MYPKKFNFFFYLIRYITLISFIEKDKSD
jgi:hypothetical protein